MELDGEAARHYIGPMFTGLVSGRGLLARREERGPSARVVVGAVELADLAKRDEPLTLGESIAIDGACLSVVQALPDEFAVDATAETLARTTLGAILDKSPTGLKLTLKLLRMARQSDSLRECLVREYRAALEIFVNHDFPEGIRAAVIDKDRNPQWKPARIEEVTPELIARYFVPRGADELTFPPPKTRAQS